MTMRMPTAISSLLKTSLDRLYAEFNYPDSATDPIHIVRRFQRPDDREIVAFCAAGLAFGRVASVLQSIERLLTVMGPHPAAFVRRFDPRRDGAARRAGSRRVGAHLAAAACRAPRYPRHSGWHVPPADPLRQPRLADGPR